MIRGYFRQTAGQRRPFVQAHFVFPGIPGRLVDAHLLIDTGADRTILGPQDAVTLPTDLRSLPSANPSRGIGGQLTAAHWIDSIMTLDGFVTPHRLTILVPENPSLRVTSVLGRDITRNFALYLDERNNLVLLLEPDEADTLLPHLPVSES